MPTAPRNYRPYPKAPRPDPRPPSHKRGYDAKWKRLRDWWLAKQPLCARCGKPARLVDHIVPICVAPWRVLDVDNLQSLCAVCHASKTKKDKLKYPEHY